MKCELAYRSQRDEPFHWCNDRGSEPAAPGLTGAAIAVTEGVVKGETIRLITTNDRRVHEQLQRLTAASRPEGYRILLAPEERFFPNYTPGPQNHPKKPKEHAEDVARRYFADQKRAGTMDDSATIRMGSHPRACEHRTPDYCNNRENAWISHEYPQGNAICVAPVR